MISFQSFCIYFYLLVYSTYYIIFINLKLCQFLTNLLEIAVFLTKFNIIRFNLINAYILNINKIISHAELNNKLGQTKTHECIFSRPGNLTFARSLNVNIVFSINKLHSKITKETTYSTAARIA